METTYQYQITHDGAVLASGKLSADLSNRPLHETEFWLDVLRDLAEKANLAICIGERWCHPADSNFDPLDDDKGEVIDVQATYGIADPRGSLPYRYKAMRV